MTQEGAFERLWPTLRGLSGSVWLLVVGVLVVRIGSFFMLFATLFLKRNGFSDAELPPVLVAVAVASVVGTLFAGRLADRIGRRPVLLIALATSAASMFLLAAVTTKAELVIAACLAGLCTQAYLPPAAAAVVDYTAEGERVPAFALFRLAFNLGLTAGLLLAAAVSYDYRLLFVIDGATSVLFLLSLARWFHDEEGERPPAATARADVPAGTGTRSADHSLGVMLFLVAVIAVGIVYSQDVSSFPLHLESVGKPTSTFGLLLALNSLLVAILQVPISAVTRRLRWIVPMTIGAGLIAAGMTVSLAVASTSMLVFGVLIWTAGEVTMVPVADNAIAELASADRVAGYQSYLASARSLALSLGPAAGVFLFAHAPGWLPWACAAVGGLAVGSLLASTLMVERGRARTGEASPAHGRATS